MTATALKGAAACLVAVSSAGFGLAAAASITAALPIRFPHGPGAAGFPAFYYYREGLELVGFLLVALLAPVAIVVGLQLWTRLAARLGDRVPGLPPGEAASRAAVPFLGLLAVLPSLPLLATERSLDLGSAAAVALVLFGGGWWFVTRSLAPGIAVAIAVGGAAGASLSSLPAEPSLLVTALAAVAGAAMAGWVADRQPTLGVWLLPIALIPLTCGLGVSLVDGGIMVARQGLSRWVLCGLAISLVASAGALLRRPTPALLRGRVASVAGAVVLAGVCLNPAVDRADLDTFHEGEWLGSAQMSITGGVPCRDINVLLGFGHAIGRPLVAFRLFGVDVKAVRLLDAGLVSLTAIVACTVAALCLGRGAFAVLLLLVVTLGPGSFAFGPRTLVAWAAMVPFLIFIKTPRWWLAATGGLTAVTATLWAFDTGGAVLLGELAVVILALVRAPQLRRRLAQGFLGGVVVGLAAATGWLAMSGVLGAFVASQADLVANVDRAFGRPFLFALETAPDPWLAFLVPVVVVAALAVLLWRALAGPLGAWELELALLVAVSGAMYRRALDRSDFSHIVLASAYAWIPALMLLGLLVDSRARRVAVGVIVAMLLLLPTPQFLPARRTLGAVVSWLGSRGVEDVTGRVLMRGVPRLGLRISPEQADELGPLLRELMSHGEDAAKVVDFSNHGAVLFLADRVNATHFPQMFTASSPASQDEVVRDLAREQPLVIWRSGTGMDRLDRIDNLVRHHRIAAAINRSAHAVDHVGSFLLVETGGHGTPTAADSPVDALALGHLPLVWGDAIGGTESLGAWRWDPNGVRAIDPTLGRFEIAAAGSVFALPLPSELKRPVAVALDMTLGVSTSVALSWFDEELPDRQFSVSFETVGDGHRHTYWIPLENHPGWAWARGVQRVFLGFERPPGVVDLGPLRAAGLP